MGQAKMQEAEVWKQKRDWLRHRIKCKSNLPLKIKILWAEKCGLLNSVVGGPGLPGTPVEVQH